MKIEDIKDKCINKDKVNSINETDNKEKEIMSEILDKKDIDYNKREFLINIEKDKKYTLNIDSNVIDVDIRYNNEESFKVYIDNYEKIKKKERLKFKVVNIEDKIDIILKYKGVNISNNSMNISGHNSSISINNIFCVGNKNMYINTDSVIEMNEDSYSDNMSDVKLVVLIPKSGGILSHMYVNTISSDVIANNLETEGNIKIISKSGDVNLKNNKCEKGDINTVSGDVIIDNVIFNELNLKTASGDITCEKTNSKTTACASMSGDIDMHQCEGEDVSLNSMSGDVLLSSIKYEYIDISTMSGDISLNNKSILEYKIKSLRTKTMSGSEKIFANYEF